MNQKRNSSLLGAVDGCAIVTFYSRAIRIESNQHGVKEKEIVWARDKNRRHFCCFFSLGMSLHKIRNRNSKNKNDVKASFSTDFVHVLLSVSLEYIVCNGYLLTFFSGRQSFLIKNFLCFCGFEHCAMCVPLAKSYLCVWNTLNLDETYIENGVYTMYTQTLESRKECWLPALRAFSQSFASNSIHFSISSPF